MPVCFIITPIGESGSEIRQNADDLRDLIIKPVMESFGFTVVRGDHRSEAGQIDIDVIRAVQESDLCVVDVSLPNPNVYYEFGRRDETGKPLILLKAKGSDDLPVDVATRRYIEYDLDSRRGLIDAREQLKNFVQPIVDNGFESSGNGTSLSELAEILKRVERKLDRMSSVTESRAPQPIPAGDGDEEANPVDLFKLAVRQRNIPMAERAMDILGYRMDQHRWLDQVVEQVAAMGSRKAGSIMIEHAYEFIDNAQSFEDKLDFLGCLVTNLNRTDREQENLELVEGICETLKAISVNEPKESRTRIFNQLNRLYHGIYISTKEVAWIQKAINELEKALLIAPEFNYLHYNLALCLRDRDADDDIQQALRHVLLCIKMDGENNDSDHLELACEIMYKLGDERLMDVMSVLETVNPTRAKLLKARWKI